ncbi:hypothetical protein Pfo_015066 [Paulownia fortunei]|nr:hypothetical protein Pfo_015066 [Paulownia fortunei]
MAGAYANGNVIVMPRSYASDESSKPVEEWFQNLDQAKETRTKLHFYFQDVLGGDSPTVWKVAESGITSTSATTFAASPSSFGLIYMADNLLTDGPEPDSKIVGRAQGMIAFADLHDIAIYMVVNIVFTEGKYSGSTISILGRNLLSEEERELPIVGGTGVFRMARGIAVTSTRSSFDENNKSYEVLEYTLYVRYY